MRRTGFAVAAAAVLAAAGAAGALATVHHAGAGTMLTRWPEFGLNAQRSSTTDASTGITAANVARLHVRHVQLPGTVDSSAIFLSNVNVDGTTQNAIFVTTAYGITLAISPASGEILWKFTPPGISSWAGSYQYTAATPIADPNGQYIYATSPNGLVHKLAIASGSEASGWPVRVTPLAAREKLTSALGIAGGELLASTGGYYGDAAPYVGHILAINLQSGHIDAVFNTLCANRHTVIDPASCNASDSAIWSRGGPVVLAGGRRVAISTGNGPWNGTTDFGDSVIELSLPDLRYVAAYTPVDQAHLNQSDSDLGSGGPVLLSGGALLQGGKDGQLRVISSRHLDGRAKAFPERTGGQLQLLPTPGGAQLYSEPAVWHDHVFVADGAGTTAYVDHHHHLHAIWSNGNHGTSPVLAGGLLYVYDMDDGGIKVYDPLSGKLVTTLACGGGHWNSPIVVDGYVIEPEGNANDHDASGVLDIWSAS
jgi:hypothetical protein